MNIVSISPRVIAAGVHKPENGNEMTRVVRFTLALMPVPYQEGQVGVALEHWPEAIETLLANKSQTRGIAGTEGIVVNPPAVPWALRFTPVRANGMRWSDPGAPGTVEIAADHIAVDSLVLNGRVDKQLPDVDRLWNWVMSEGAGVTTELWPALKAVIEETGKKQNRQGSQDKLDVAGVGRAEAAFCLLAERAQAACKAVSPNAPVCPPAEPNVTPSESVKPFDDIYLRKGTAEKQQQDQQEVAKRLKETMAREDEHREIGAALNVAKEARKLIAGDRKDFLNAGQDAAAAVEALRKMSISPNGKLAVPGGYTPQAMLDCETRKTVLGLLRGLHRAATATDAPAPQKKDTALADAGLAKATPAPKRGATVLDLDPDNALSITARQMLFALHASPTLGRLFRFVVDVQVDVKTLFSSPGLSAWRAPGDAPEASFFALAGCTFGANSQNLPPPVSTVTKFAYSDGQLAHVWPALREEMLISLWAGEGASAGAKAALRRKAVTQSNGLVKLGQTLELEGGAPLSVHRRYDLVTLDPVFAIDAHLRRNERLQDRVNAAAAITQTQRSAREAEAMGPFISRGLCVVDRWRQGAVVAEIVNAAHFAGQSHPRIVDAADLTTGYRVMLGLTGNAGEAPVWRSLMGRTVTYADVSPVSARIEDSLNRLSLSPTSERRRLSDAASIAVPSRTRRTATGFCAHVEEIVTAWEGDPLALSCYAERHTVTVKAGSDIAVSRTYGLEVPDKEKPFLLRFGKAYQVAIGPVWLGGVCVGNDEVRTLAAKDPDLRLPTQVASANAAAQASRPFRRFLRHEPIMPPALLLPVTYAERRDKYIRQTGPKVILRKRPQGEPDLDKTSWRVLMPPRMSIDDIWRHGVLDKERDTAAPPKGGFPKVDIDTEWGDFPAYGRPAAAAERGTVVPVPSPSAEPLARLLARQTGPKQGSKSLPPEAQGEVVFMASSGAERKAPYYPDPAAEQLVIALRPNAGSVPTAYFDGAPIVVDVSPDPERFRDAVPVVIVFERIDEKRPAADALNHADFVRDPVQDRFTDGRTLALKESPKWVRVKVVTVRLYEGEHVSADCWFLPRQQTLRRWFDLPESVVATSGVSTPPQTVDEAAQALDKLFPENKPFPADKPVSSRLRELRALARAERGGATGPHPSTAQLAASWISAAGVPVTGGIVAAVSDTFAQAMRYRPVPQIACVRTIDALHAVVDPVLKPAFDWSSQNKVLRRSGKVLAVTRYRAGNEEERSQQLEVFSQLVAASDGDILAAWQGRIPCGATGVLLAGKVFIDRNTCAQMEVIASVVAPQAKPIDNPERKRPADMRISGLWSTYRDAERQPKAENIFGFRVASDGRVELPVSPVTLLHIESLDAWDGETKFAGLDLIDLALEQERAIEAEKQDKQNRDNGAALEDKKPTGPRVTSYDPFKDPMARKLRLKLRATGRFGEFLRPIVPDDTGSSPAVPVGEAMSVDAPAVSMPEDALEVWLPATRRPSPPKLHALLPSFAWTCGKPEADGFATLVREPKLRVWLDRPWFSSGEGERLGIVLWPPNITSLAASASGQAAGHAHRDPYEQLASGLVPRRGGGEGAGAWMDLSDFVDDVLGAAGKFVTRWGADPIRQAPERLGPFMTPTAFKDLPINASTPGGDGPQYVPSVSMPILSEEENSTECNKEHMIQQLEVALITYEPRFDVDTERWYVDVALNPEAIPGLVEPFVRLGLVRFQEHAAQNLHVSAPVSAWGQVLPARTLTVWWEKKPTASEDGFLMAQVSGPYATRVDAQGNHVVPRMRFAVARSTTQAELRTESLVSDWQDPAPGAPSRATSQQGNAWTASLRVPAGTQMAHVLVEEDEKFSSTDDDVVAAEGMHTSQASYSGPRYAARLQAPTI